MASPADREASKVARRFFGKRGIDVANADVRVSHGVCFVRGVVGVMPGSECEDLHAALEQTANLLRKRPEIRDVSIDVAYRLGGETQS
jgi:hypothetical protein